MKNLVRLILAIGVLAFLPAFQHADAKGKHKVPVIQADGTRQDSKQTREYDREREESRNRQGGRSENLQRYDDRQDNAGTVSESHPSPGELHFTARVPKREYDDGEYRPRRPAHWSGRTGGMKFTLDRSESGSEEVSNVTVSCSKEGWKKYWTPLHQAAAVGDLGAMKNAFEKGVSPDVSTELMTPLHVAAAMGEEESARFLLQKGAHLSVKAFDGETPQQMASACRHPELARLLTVFTTAEQLTHGEKTITVRLENGHQTDLTSELRRIAAGFRDEHRHDGTVFGNYEEKLPARDRYYYTEFVHRTSSRSPGACRIVIGLDGDVWYTPDHYNHFIRVDKR